MQQDDGLLKLDNQFCFAPHRRVAARLAQLAAASLISVAGSPVAHAHISVEMGGTHVSRAGEGELKEGPCGVADAPRGAMVYKYKPGATINVSIAETIPHPGYFRISFDSDGVDGFVDPSSTTGEGGNCAGDANCGASKEDYCSNETVLLDALDQHSEASFGQMYTWSVTLPNVECTNCTLQIIQVMNDLNVHPGAFPAGDIYYACIDLELSNSAPDVSDTPVTNNGMSCAPATDPGAAGAAGAGAAGSAAGGAGAAGVGAAGAGAAGSGEAEEGTSGNAGAEAGSAAAPSGGASSPRPTPPSTTAAGSSAGPTGAAGSAPAPPSGMQNHHAAGAAAAPAATSSQDGGGCQAAPAGSLGLFTPFAVLCALLSLTWRRRMATQTGARRADR